MVNIQVRVNEKCVVDLPACDYVFSSTRGCFIGYGFKESALEKSLVIKILEQRGIEGIDAGGSTSPGKYAFCTKICSKIITSQFCIILLNNDVRNISGDRHEFPNANVNMEYGLALGFNKYVIPFQRDEQILPFNVSGLDTIKYNNSNFEKLAESAIDQAIFETSQKSIEVPKIDQILDTYILSTGAMISNIDNKGDKDIFRLGAGLKFNLLNSFDGFKYTYFGNFTNTLEDITMWRVQTLNKIITARFDDINKRLQLGLITPQQIPVVEAVRSGLSILVLVQKDDERDRLIKWAESINSIIQVKFISASDVTDQLKTIGFSL